MRHILTPALVVITALLVGCGDGDNGGGNGATPAPTPTPNPTPNPTPTPAPEDTHEVRLRTVVGGLQRPWSFVFLPNGDILVTERPGRIRLVRGGVLRTQPVAGVPAVVDGGQGGMLDLALHPRFSENSLVYISYAKAVSGGSTTAVARARWEGDALVDLADIIVTDAVASGGQHFGGRMVFDAAGFLYLSIGDRGTGSRAQDRTDHAGSTLRLRDDGGLPGDNPFVGVAGVEPAIFTYGNRNAQGMTIHPSTGAVWLVEHGPMGGDEVNRVVAGGNYGWPQTSFGSGYDGTPIPDPTPGDGTVLPLLYWTPSIAPSGMAFYSGDRFPNWRGNLFVGALAGTHLRRVVLDGTQVLHQEQLLLEEGQRIRAVRTGPDGYLYLVTDDDNGILGRVEPIEEPPVGGG